MAQSKRPRMEVSVYENLLAISAGFEQVCRALGALRHERGFERREIARFRAMAEEARAATLSYLIGIIEIAETDEAGRLSSRRRARERGEEGS